MKTSFFPLALSWVCQIIAAAILGIAAYNKIIGHEESVKLFLDLGLGDTARVLIGVMEALAVAMLLTSNLNHLGALLGFCTMIGALIAHATVVGFVDETGSAVLSYLMLTVMGNTLIVCYIHRKKLPLINSMFED